MTDAKYAEAKRLLELEDDDVYERELGAWVVGEGRERLAALLVDVIECGGNSAPSYLQWPVDAVAYLPDGALSVVEGATPHDEAPKRTATRKGFDGSVPDALLEQLFGDGASISLHEKIREAIAVRRDPVGHLSAEGEFEERPSPLAPPHHLALPLDARLSTTTHPPYRFARRHHPSWTLDGASGGIEVVVGGRREKRDVASRSFALLRLPDLGALIPGSTFGPLDVDLPADLLWNDVPCFVRHDDSGRADAILRSDGTRSPSDAGLEVRRLVATIVPSPADFEFQDWGHSNGRENLIRIGGEPTFIQYPEYPKCPDCDATMPPLAQFEQGLPWVDGVDALDEGIAYVFLCTWCRISSWTKQRT